MRLTVDLSWNANTETDLSGYKLTWGDGRSAERAVMVRGNVTAMQVSALVKGNTLTTFAVQAFDVAGNLSEKKVLKAVWVEG
jgi:hypothetical protein